MDFITIDFETATAARNSPCEVGLTFVENNKIVDTKSWLIKPIYPVFDSFNVFLHGITENDVADQPEFDELWSELQPLISNRFLIAHNASFDFSVLRRTLETYNLTFPTLDYSCSYIISKKIWEGLPNYGLKSLCKLLDIPLEHHRAAPDSRATAELAIKAFDIAAVNHIDEFPEKLQIITGRLYEGSYRPSEKKRQYKPNDLSLIVGDPSKLNPDSIFYGKSVVFTGTLSSMQRNQAQQLIADVGGINSNGVTKDTNYLIVGQQDFRVVGEDGMSNKQEKAVKLIQKGAPLEILSEIEFIRNL